MNINEYLEKTFELIPGLNFEFGRIRPRVFCIDGENVSIQASDGMYCSPRVTQPTGYLSIELGYPSFEDKRLMKYCEDIDNPKETVYARVPVELVDEILDEHGGIDFDRSLEEGKRRKA